MVEVGFRVGIRVRSFAQHILMVHRHKRRAFQRILDDYHHSDEQPKHQPNKQTSRQLNKLISKRAVY